MATATATHTIHTVTADHIKRFEKKVTAIKNAVEALPGDDFYNEIFSFMHQPGWTTLAEGVFFEAALDNTLAHAQQLSSLHQQLKAGAMAVGQ